jgi:hypothetical protein
MASHLANMWRELDECLQQYFPPPGSSYALSPGQHVERDLDECLLQQYCPAHQIVATLSHLASMWRESWMGAF